MNELQLKMRKVSPKESVSFRCVGCGECCKNIYQQVPLEALDIYRMANYLKAKGENISCVDDFLEQYADSALLDSCGYIVYFLKTKGENNVCIFLEDNHCRIHAANPRACRTYPFIAKPLGNGKYEYLLSYERTHHFKGQKIHPKTWMKIRFTQADMDFLNLDFGAAKEIARLLRSIPKKELAYALMLFQMYKYSDYDLDKPFQTQFVKNHAKLMQALRMLANNKKSQT